MKKVIIIFSILFAGTWAYIIYQHFQHPSFAWVNLSKVIKEFSYKKELESELLNIVEIRKGKIDSLESELKNLSQRVDLKKNKDEVILFEAKKTEYFQKKQQFQEDSQALAAKYDEKIYAQLNQYIQDFGKENDYAYVFGAEGSGSLMYAQEEDDVTEAVIKFINNKYKGLEK